MQFDKHGNGNGLDDLYVLPETATEARNLVAYLKTKGCAFEWSHSNVEGQTWFGRAFVEIPFGESLRPELEKLAEGKQVQP